MKWNAAVELGKACGLSTPEEFASNVELHALSLFKYTELEAEIAEMYRTAAEAGVEFPSITRIIARCDACQAHTWHREGKCLRCAREDKEERECCGK